MCMSIPIADFIPHIPSLPPIAPCNCQNITDSCNRKFNVSGWVKNHFYIARDSWNTYMYPACLVLCLSAMPVLVG